MKMKNINHKNILKNLKIKIMIMLRKYLFEKNKYFELLIIDFIIEIKYNINN